MLDSGDLKKVISLLIRLGLVGLLILWCYEIIRPFIIPFMWGGIIAIAIYPLYQKLCHWTNQRELLSSLMVALVLLSLLIIPTALLATSSIEMARNLAEIFDRKIDSQDFQLPDLKPMVAKVPLVGEWLQTFIDKKDFEDLLRSLAPVLKPLGQQLLSFSAGLGSMILQSLVAIVVAGSFLFYAQSSHAWFRRLAARVADERGAPLLELAAETTSNVAQGILGVALFQALLAGIGMILAGVPAAGLWTLLVMILATIQLPVLLVMLPISIYLFYTSTVLIALAFLALGIFSSLVDTPVRAYLMGRGSRTPMLVIMFGAIGGMLAFGIIGLFVGAVVLAVGYELLNSWMAEQEPEAEAEKEVN